MCRKFECVWKKDYDIPEWMKPSEIKALITVKICPVANERYFSFTEAGVDMRADALSWMIQHCLRTKSNLQYQVKGGYNRIGSVAFVDALAQTIKIA